MSFLTSPSQKNGAVAEAFAERYLKRQGLILIEKNFSCKLGEIDLIMQENETLVFIEVRHRVSAAYGNAVETVTREKQNKIIKASTLFMMKHKLLEKKSVRFDVFALQGKLASSPQINWVKQAFNIMG
ncbi:MAG: YraN family protein [Legionellales bacterium]|nr:YraN family protein [Legionellales bacterium]